MVKIRIPRVIQPPRETLEAEMNRLKQELEAEKSSNKQLRASIDVMQIGWDLDKQKLLETTANLEKCPGINTNTAAEVPNLTVQSGEASGNVRRTEERLLTCSLCCKETFPNIEQFQKHLRTVGANLMCPFCVRPKCICSLSKHLDKGCPRINKLPPLPYKFFAQQYFTKEAQTQTSESSITLPLQDIMAMVSVKMVQTLDKNGVKRVLPHLIMEPYCKAKVNTENTSGTNKPIQFGEPCVQKVPADSTGTHNLSPIHSSKDPLWKTSGTENLNSNTSQTQSIQSLTNEHFEFPSLDSENQNNMINNKPDLYLSETVKNQEHKITVKPIEKLISSGVFKSPDGRSITSVDKLSASNNQSNHEKTNSMSPETLVSILKSKKDEISDDPVEKSLPEFNNICDEKKDKHIKKLFLSEIPNNQDENKDKSVEKTLSLKVSKNQDNMKDNKSDLLGALKVKNDRTKDKPIEKSSLLEVSKSGREKKNDKSFSKSSSSSRDNKKIDESVVGSSSSEVPKSRDSKHSKHSEILSLVEMKHQSSTGKTKSQSTEDLVSLLESKNDLMNQKTVLSGLKSQVDKKNITTPSTTTSKIKKESEKDGIKSKNVRNSNKSKHTPHSTSPLIKVKTENTSGPNKKKRTSNTESSASTSNTGGGGSDEFYCSACEVYFKSVVQHVDTHHPDEEVELEDEAYQEMPDDVKQRLVCKAQTEVTEKVKQMLLNTPKNRVESVQTFSNSQDKSNKRCNSEKTPVKKKMNLYSDGCEAYMSEEKQMKVNKKVGKVNSFKCQNCDEMFNRKLALEKHLCKSATKEQQYTTCIVCNQVIPFTKEIIDFHKKMHKEQGNGDTYVNKSKKSKRKKLDSWSRKIVQQVEKVQPVETVSKKAIPMEELVEYSKMLNCEVVLKDIGMKRLPLKRKCESELKTLYEEEVFKPKKPSTDGGKVENVKKLSENRKNDDKVKKSSRKNSKVISDVKLSSVNDRKTVGAVNISSEDSEEDYKVKRPLIENNEVQSFTIDCIEAVNETTISTTKHIEQKIQLPTEDTESFDVNNCSTEVIEINEYKVSDSPGSSGLWQEKLYQSKQIVDKSDQKIKLLRSDEKPRSLYKKQNLEKTKEQTSEETIVTTLGKIAKKASTSSGEQKGPIKAKSKAISETKSTFPTGAEDYWKSWREQLENNPEKWEKFLVEEQERFKNRQETEKQHWLKTKAIPEEAVESQKLTETEKEEYKCKDCEKSYQTAHALTVHIETIHMSQSQSEQATTKFEIDKVTPHPKSSENINKCALCLIEFTSLRQAEKHKLLHDNEDAYHCQYCPCVYQLRILLEEHLRNEHGKFQD